MCFHPCSTWDQYNLLSCCLIRHQVFMIQTNCKNFVILKNVLHWHDSCYTVVYGGGSLNSLVPVACLISSVLCGPSLRYCPTLAHHCSNKTQIWETKKVQLSKLLNLWNNAQSEAGQVKFTSSKLGYTSH